MDHGSRPRRYFSCSALNGRLYLSHVSAIDGSILLSYWTPEDVAQVLDPGKGDRRIHSVEDLEETLQISTDRPLRMLFVAEELEDEARRRKQDGSLRPEQGSSPGLRKQPDNDRS